MYYDPTTNQFLAGTAPAQGDGSTPPPTSTPTPGGPDPFSGGGGSTKPTTIKVQGPNGTEVYAQVDAGGNTSYLTDSNGNLIPVGSTIPASYYTGEVAARQAEAGAAQTSAGAAAANAATNATKVANDYSVQMATLAQQIAHDNAQIQLAQDTLAVQKQQNLATDAIETQKNIIALQQVLTQHQDTLATLTAEAQRTQETLQSSWDINQANIQNRDELQQQTLAFQSANDALNRTLQVAQAIQQQQQFDVTAQQKFAEDLANFVKSPGDAAVAGGYLLANRGPSAITEAIAHGRGTIDALSLAAAQDALNGRDALGQPNPEVQSLLNAATQPVAVAPLGSGSGGGAAAATQAPAAAKPATPKPARPAATAPGAPGTFTTVPGDLAAGDETQQAKVANSLLDAGASPKDVQDYITVANAQKANAAATGRTITPTGQIVRTAAAPAAATPVATVAAPVTAAPAHVTASGPTSALTGAQLDAMVRAQSPAGTLGATPRAPAAAAVAPTLNAATAPAPRPAAPAPVAVAAPAPVAVAPAAPAPVSLNTATRATPSQQQQLASYDQQQQATLSPDQYAKLQDALHLAGFARGGTVHADMWIEGDTPTRSGRAGKANPEVNIRLADGSIRVVPLSKLPTRLAQQLMRTRARAATGALIDPAAAANGSLAGATNYLNTAVKYGLGSMGLSGIPTPLQVATPGTSPYAQTSAAGIAESASGWPSAAFLNEATRLQGMTGTIGARPPVMTRVA